MKQLWWIFLLSAVWLVACNNAVVEDGRETAVLSLPQLETADLQGGKLRVVATTSVIGDVIAQIGGGTIDLTILIEPGQDPHSYEPGARALTAVAEAHVIFVNGWNLEEGLLNNLENVAEAGQIVPISANITPRESETTEPNHHHQDPHVWLDPQNVQQWVRNVEQVLTALDPANSEQYAAKTATYRQELEELMLEMDEMMVGLNGRHLVTNHDALGYLVARYDLNVIGTVLPGTSTLAEPSAADLADLATKMTEAQTCTIFAETTANMQLAEAAAAELDSCLQVKVLSLYIGALGLPGSGAESYIGMMRANTQTLAEGLK